MPVSTGASSTAAKSSSSFIASSSCTTHQQQLSSAATVLQHQEQHKQSHLGIGEPKAKRCKLCDESNHCNGEAGGNGGDGSDSGGGGYWLQLDRDLVETISSIYPDWFAPVIKDTINNNSPATANNNATCKPSPLNKSLPSKTKTSSKSKSEVNSAKSNIPPKPTTGTKRTVSGNSSLIANQVKIEPTDIKVKLESVEESKVAVGTIKLTSVSGVLANCISNKLGNNRKADSVASVTVTMADRASNGNISSSAAGSVGIVLGVGSNGLVGAGALTGGLVLRESPPKAIVDTSPLLNSLEQNKESLKVKLLLRRPVEQLVAQGIMPPLKTPAAFHGQRRQLERAKTGDLLKSKIQQRPSRYELESRHILEADPKHVDPSLAEKQRMLKKAKLADQLNDQLSHRPGPLELIEKNILHTEEPIEQAVKTGRIPYRATCEGNLNRPQHPLSYITPEEDSQSSEDNLVSPGPPTSDVLEAAAKSAGIVVSLIPASEGTVVVTTAASPFSKDSCPADIVFPDLRHQTITSTSSILCHQQVSSPISLVSTSTLSPLSSVASPISCQISSQPSTPAPQPIPITLATIPSRPSAIQSPIIKSDAPGKDKYRKKCKSKNAPKTRTIKFHEYKGPPSAHKNSILPMNTNGESSYDLLLQQQTLLLQFQLQLQHKYPQIILPANQKIQAAPVPVDPVQIINTNNNTMIINSCSSNSNTSISTISNPLPSPSPSTASESSVGAPSTPANSMRITGRLEDMKVSDLKAELKRRSLPVSGSKPQLIERLKPFIDQVSNSVNEMPMSNASTIDESHNSPPQPSQSDVGSPGTAQLNSIDESSDQMELGEPPSPSPQPVVTTRKDSLTQEDIVREQQLKIEKLQRELLLSQLKLQAAQRAEPKKMQVCQQQLQQLQQLQQARQAQSNEEQQRIQQQQHIAFQNQKNLNGGNGIILNGFDGTSLLNHFMQGSAKLINGLDVKSQPILATTTITPSVDVKQEYISIDEVKPPPIYEEATKYSIKKEPRKHIKSQTVEDVLEILIKNGELPPSAAQDPLTPVSADTKSVEPVYPQVADSSLPDSTLGIDENEIFNNLDMDNVDFSQFAMELGLQTMDNNHMQDSNTNTNANMVVPMDTDEWLESLLPSSTIDDNQIQLEQNANTILQQNHHPSFVDCTDPGSYDPLLGIIQEPFDPFGLEEYRNLTWDRVDFAA